MNKAELVQWLIDEQQKWELLLVAIGETRMDQPGVNGDWSIRDIIAHLTVWQQWMVVRMQAVARDQPTPLPPWPVEITTDAAINDWIVVSQRSRTVRQVLADAQAVYDQTIATINALPETCVIDTIEAKFHVIWVNATTDQGFVPGQFFHHFYDDHAGAVRTWLERGA